ncbi:hypothetical protein BT96DRAFT_974975 [Gymnopus androsaceus JB14]|uniref:Uncharacterized protein n=1 Tax=Gymnopus androsaceus JB14 TaxID=1447944 RepID=A0A6A4HSJ4_9AGAR|nr:hypothetical protein BT96DRAFT_974975 [Gymnopus androsaceus JB14]
MSFRLQRKDFKAIGVKHVLYGNECYSSYSQQKHTLGSWSPQKLFGPGLYLSSKTEAYSRSKNGTVPEASGLEYDTSNDYDSPPIQVKKNRLGTYILNKFWAQKVKNPKSVKIFSQAGSMRGKVWYISPQSLKLLGPLGSKQVGSAPAMSPLWENAGGID